MLPSICILILVSLCIGQNVPLPCDPNNGRFKSYPFCNELLPIKDRVNNLLGHISIDDKLVQFANGAGALPSVDLPSYQWWSEALHGVAYSPGVHFGGDIPAATSFPQVCLTAASFNRTLYYAIGSVVSTEARAMNNEGRAGLTFWTPNINIFRDPRWGRGQETPGECPFLTAEYAASYLPGLQADPSFPSRLKVSSCCKHWAAYDLENWHGVDRYHFDAIVTKQDEADTFFPAFESCVTRGKGSGIMCSYNAVNGIPSCANKGILNDLVRDKWGYEGYITSDCGAVGDVQYTHHYTNTTDQTLHDTLTAGMDIDCGTFVDQHIKQALQDGAITTKDIDAALFNLFSVQMRLGMFDNPANIPWKAYKADMVNTAYAQHLALNAAQQSIVLLKNEGNTLPLDSSKYNKIAVIGPNANVTHTLQGNYYGSAPYLITPLMAFQKGGQNPTYAMGCDIAGSDKSGFAEAVSNAKSADAVVMVMGLDESQESEGHDRDIIAFPGVQADLIQAVATAAAGKPVILVMMNGGPVDISAPKANNNVQGIMWVGYPGQSGGTAIQNVVMGIFGPSGRLPHTIYPADYVNQVSMLDMNMRPGKNNPGRTYRFYTGTPVYEFGSGLTYTTFDFQSLTIANNTLSMDTLQNDINANINHRGDAPVVATAYATLKNTGSRTNGYTGLLYAVPPHAGTRGFPIKELVQFEKAYIVNPNESTKLALPLTAFSFAAADSDGNFTPVYGTWVLMWENNNVTVTVK